jgi:hypothetical protein
MGALHILFKFEPSSPFNKYIIKLSREFLCIVCIICLLIGLLTTNGR